MYPWSLRCLRGVEFWEKDRKTTQPFNDNCLDTFQFTLFICSRARKISNPCIKCMTLIPTGGRQPAANERYTDLGDNPRDRGKNYKQNTTRWNYPLSCFPAKWNDDDIVCRVIERRRPDEVYIVCILTTWLCIAFPRGFAHNHGMIRRADEYYEVRTSLKKFTRIENIDRIWLLMKILFSGKKLLD